VIRSVIIRLTLVLPSLVLLAACSSAPPIPTNSFYRLDITDPETRLDNPLLKGVLSVQVGAAIPLYRDRALLHSEPGNESTLQRYHYHYWVDTPPHLLQIELADYLRTAGVAEVVVMPEDSVDERYRLRLDIDRFEHQRGTGGGKVRVGVRLLLTERVSGKLLLQQQLQADAIVQGNEYSKLAVGYQQAVAELCGQVVTLLQAQQFQP